MDHGRTAGLHFSRLFVFCVSILLTNYFISSRANANDAFVEIGIGLEQADAIAYTDRKRCNLKMGCFFEIEDVLINFVALSTGLQVSLASRNGDFVFFDGTKSYDLHKKGGVASLQVSDASGRDYVEYGLNAVAFILYVAV